MAEHQTLLAEADRCVRCGACQAHCPVYQVEGLEGMVARGRITLAAARARDQLGPDRPLPAYLSSCLLCGRCQAGCPNEVDTPLVIRLAREQHLAGSSGRLRSWLLARLLPSSRRLERMVGAARLLRPLWARRLPRESGLRLRLASPRGGPRRWLPAPARPILQRRHLPRSFSGSGPQVALFPGCVSNFLAPSQGLAAIEVLEGLGAQVALARDLVCCGLMALGSGDTATARRLASRNLELLWPMSGPEPDFVTSQCSSCAYMLKIQLPRLLRGTALAERARQFSEKVTAFSRLAIILGFCGSTDEEEGKATGAGESEIVTWHDPCHLAVGLGIHEEPRKILSSLAGATYRESGSADKCCGNGGLFAVAHPRLSWRIAERKLEGIRDTEARAIITECSGCYLQLGWLASEGWSRLGGQAPEVLSLPEAMVRFSEIKK